MADMILIIVWALGVVPAWVIASRVMARDFEGLHDAQRIALALGLVMAIYWPVMTLLIIIWKLLNPAFPLWAFVLGKTPEGRPEPEPEPEDEDG